MPEPSTGLGGLALGWRRAYAAVVEQGELVYRQAVEVHAEAERSRGYDCHSVWQLLIINSNMHSHQLPAALYSPEPAKSRGSGRRNGLHFHTCQRRFHLLSSRRGAGHGSFRGCVVGAPSRAPGARLGVGGGARG